MNGKISKVEMTNDSTLYVIAEEKFLVYTIDTTAKNSLEKIH